MIESNLNYEIKIDRRGANAQTHFTLAKGTRVRLGNELIVFDERVNAHIEREIPYDALVETITASGLDNAGANAENFGFTEEREIDGENALFEIRYDGRGARRESIVETEVRIVDPEEVKKSIKAEKSAKKTKKN